MKILRQSRQDKGRYVLGVFSVIWIVITSGGVFFSSEAIINITLIFDVVLLTAQIVLAQKFIMKRYTASFGQLLIMIAFVLLSILLTSDYSSWLTYARLLLILSLAFGTSLLIDNSQIEKVFIKVVIFLAAASVVLFYSELISKNQSIFPVINFHDHQYINAFIYLHFESSESRNFGIFIEPGLYQIYLNFCLFALLYGNQNIRHKYIFIAILLLAIFSTKSTTGYILSIVIIGFLVFKKLEKKKSIILFVARTAFLVLSIILIVRAEFFTTNIEEKFNSNKQVSFITRQNSTLIDLLIIKKNPLTGSGVGSYQNTLDKYDATGLTIDAATNTFTQLGAIVGLPFVLLIVFRIFVSLVRFHADTVTKIVFFILYVVCFSTQPVVLYPIFYLLIFMSFETDKTRRHR